MNSVKCSESTSVSPICPSECESASRLNADAHRLAVRDREALVQNYGMTFDIDFGEAFFNSLFWGTLRTLADRVEPTGFCHTSFGECGDVKCYDITHYPRDTAEAASVLCRVGLVDRAEAILDFTLRHIPDGQLHIPHVYNHDGSVRANTVQVDTPGIVAIALSEIVDRVGATDRARGHYEVLSRIIDATWAKHFHSTMNLLDAGNYNEQFTGGDELMCDIFTNSAFYAGLMAMMRSAEAFGDSAARDRWTAWLQCLQMGIDGHLLDENEGLYRTFIDPSGRHVGGFDWHSVYCSRWFPMRHDILNCMLDRCESETIVDIDRFRVITCEPNQRTRVLGKVFGCLLGLLARTRRWSQLTHQLDFARSTIRRPSNVFPEWWYLYEDRTPSAYWEGFWKIHAGTWTSYEKDPDGDYTIDSGNCEQSSVFLSHMLTDLAGLNLSNLPAGI